MSPGLPVVFVHGIRLSGTMWHPVMERIGRDHPTAAPDLPGHGRRRGEIFTAEGAVDAVAGAIDELGGRALVVGLSLGGYVAQAVAGRDPRRVAGLVARAARSHRPGRGDRGGRRRMTTRPRTLPAGRVAGPRPPSAAGPDRRRSAWVQGTRTTVIPRPAARRQAGADG